MSVHISRFTAAATWLLLAAVLIAPFAYIAFGRPESSFIDNVMSGLLATAAALVGGIPVALWIDRIVKHREEKKQKEMERRRELELLDLIKEELSFTSGLHQQRMQKPGTILIQPLKSDLWGAIAAAGKLNLIQNHRLLNRITSAYYVINLVRKIEEEAYTTNPGQIYFPDKSGTDLFSCKSGVRTQLSLI